MNLKKQISFTFLTQFTTFVFSFLYSILIARALGPELRGIFFLLQTYQSLVVVLMSVSVQTIMTVALSRKEFALNDVNTSAIILSVFFGLPAIIVGYSFYNLSLNNNLIETNIVLLFFATSPLSIFKIMWNSIMLGLSEISLLNWLSILDTFLLTVLTIIAVGILELGIKGLIFAFLINNMAITIFEVLIFRYKLEFKWTYSKECIKNLLSLGWKQHIAIIAYNLYMRADAFILAMFSTPSNIGYYSVAKGLTNNVSIAINPITQVMFPHISAAKDEKSKYFTLQLIKVIFVILLVFSLSFYFLAPFIIKLLYGNKYIISIEHSRILIFSVLALSLQVPINLWFVGNLKKPEFNSFINLFTLVILVFTCISFTKWGGMFGISWAVLISYIASTFYAFFLANKKSLKFRLFTITKKDLKKI